MLCLGPAHVTIAVLTFFALLVFYVWEKELRNMMIWNRTQAYVSQVTFFSVFALANSDY